MLTKYILNKILLLVLLFSVYCNGQQIEETEENIEEKFKEYFSNEREHIHLHLNKNSYLTNENIWFKGYIINKKTPFQYTTNIHVKIYDAFETLKETKLIFASNGFFGGTIDLNSNYKSGKYKIHVYTNYMNNFIEDESSTYEISILNPNENEETTTNNINFKTISTSFFPESGTFLSNFSNMFGVKIGDCHNNGIEIKNVEVLNSHNEVISTFNTNEYGVGKFEIINAIDSNYKVRYLINGIEKLDTLPTPKKTGVNFSINSFSIENKIILKIRKSENKERVLKLIIFQESDANFFNINIPENKNEITIDVEKDLFFNGVNNVILLNENNTKIAERLVFVYKPKDIETENGLIITQKRTDSITFTGKSQLINGSVSISVLPSESNTKKVNTSITTKYYLDAFLENPSYISYEELTTKKRSALFEIDKMLLSNKSKYKWENIKAKPKDLTYEFDRGISIKGTVNTLEKNKGNLIVNMKAIGLGINNNAIINEKNEFEFKNVIAVDSTKLYFTVIDNTRKKLDHKIYSTLQSNSRNFLKPLFKNSDCEKIIKKIAIEKQDYPKIEGAINLDSVSINAKKDRLKYDNQKGNFYSRGFKITDEIATKNRDLLDFISKNGFDVRRVKGYITINGYNYGAALANETVINGTFRRNFGPAVFIDNLQVLDYNSLEGYTLNNIDEIYLDKSRNDLTFANWTGSIKIFTKKNNFIVTSSKKSESIFIKNGFQNYTSYRIPKYENYSNNAFKKFGTLNWIPHVETDENGLYRFSIPNLYQKKIRIIIEGISEDGKIVSEVRDIDVE